MEDHKRVVLVKELPEKYVGDSHRKPLMVPGWKTWVRDTYVKYVGKEGEVIILEDNKWSSNFPAECFALYGHKLEDVLKL